MATTVPSDRGLEKAKLINGRKQHLLVTTTGLLLAVISRSEPLPCITRQGLARYWPAWVVRQRSRSRIQAHSGYHGQLLAWVARRFAPVPGRVMAAQTQRLSAAAALLGGVGGRRLSKDYEGLESSIEKTIHILMMVLTLRYLARN